MLRRIVWNLSTLLALTTTAFASTWVVDDNGGPGVDFTSISAALAAVAPGDIILVRPGNYAGFTIGSSVTILGTFNVIVTSPVEITNVPAGQRVSLVALRMPTLRISGCLAPITIEDSDIHPGPSDFPGLQLGTVRVSNCVDVRFRRILIQPTFSSVPAVAGLHVTGSRVEITGSALVGGYGDACGPGIPGTAQPGAPAIFAADGANVHVAMCSLIGANGGGAFGSGCQSPFAGAGAPALHVGSNASAIVSGTAVDFLSGGGGGDGGSCAVNGAPASGIVVTNGNLRVSGVTITGADDYPGCGGPAPQIVGAYTQPTPPDPTLEFVGTQIPGQLLQFTLRGAPGDTAQLVFGRQLAIADVPNVAEDQLLLPLRTLAIGVLPANGELMRWVPVPSTWTAGQLIVAQGRTTSPAGNVSLTHSVPITLR